MTLRFLFEVMILKKNLEVINKYYTSDNVSLYLFYTFNSDICSEASPNINFTKKNTNTCTSTGIFKSSLM